MMTTTRKYNRKPGANPPGRPKVGDGSGADARVTVWITAEMREQDELMMRELGITSLAELYRTYREMFYRYRKECV